MTGGGKDRRPKTISKRNRFGRNAWAWSEWVALSRSSQAAQRRLPTPDDARVTQGKASWPLCCPAVAQEPAVRYHFAA
jgi:hypothetical protein